MTQRLFIAVDLPGPIRARLVEARETIDGARWVPESQLHLTLRFLGDTSDEDRAAIADLLRAIDQPTFSIALAGVGRFPPARPHPPAKDRDHGPPRDRPAHVLWAGVTPIERLVALAAEVEAAVQGVGIAPEDRPFSPHLTLARLKDANRNAVDRFLTKHAELTSEPFEIDEFILYSSVLSSQGATHQVEERYRLERGAKEP